MNREAILSGNSRQYISITDCNLLEQIGKLLPLYKTFNRLANDAFAYGLPKLIDVKFGEKTLDDEPNARSEENPSVRVSAAIPDERIDLMIRLLQEIAMTATIGKSLACSLFNAKSAELKGKPLTAEKFDSGALRDTPTYMTKYEVERLNEMDEDDDE